MLVSAGQAGRFDAFLKHANKWGFSKDVVTLNEFLVKCISSLFQKMKSPVQYFNSLLPSKKDNGLPAEKQALSIRLPQCNLNVFKHSFVN